MNGIAKTKAGTIKYYNEPKGYGFIRVDGGAAIFFHITDLASDLYGPTTGDRISYFPGVDRAGRPRAESVTLIPKDGSGTSR